MFDLKYEMSNYEFPKSACFLKDKSGDVRHVEGVIFSRNMLYNSIYDVIRVCRGVLEFTGNFQGQAPVKMPMKRATPQWR